MKCPKCNYISFDYNQACPKCKKDLAAAKEKMCFLSYASGPPVLIDIGDSAGSETVSDDSSAGMIMEDTMTFDFPDTIDSGSQTEPAVPSSGKDSDELSLDFDDFAFDDDETLSPASEQIAPQDETLDSDLDFSFADGSDEITLSVDKTEETQKSPEIASDDETTDGEIEFDFDLEVDGQDQSDSPSLAHPSEDDITIAPFDTDSLSFEEEKDDVTSELEKSVTALVDSIEVSEEPDAPPKRHLPDLDTIDLDLDLDLDEMDNK